MPLFLPEFHQEIQAKFLDRVIPELKEDSINLANYEVIDDLLSFLELPSDPPLIPSEDIFHLLLTVSSRSSSCNWSSAPSKSKYGLVETQEQLLALKHSDQLLHKSSLTDRCIIILEKYKNLVYDGNQGVYRALQQTINQLVTKESSRKRASSISSMLKPTGESPVPELKEERNSRKRRQTEKQYREGSDDTLIVISDSEEDYNDPEFTLPQVGKQESDEASKESSLTNGTSYETWDGLRVFDEPLLKDQFRISDGKFGLWDLVNWCFYCAGLSTAYYPQIVSYSHTIYEAQATTLLFIFNIIEYNLVDALKEIFKDQDSYVALFNGPKDKNKLASLQVEDNSSILLSRLLKSLGYLQSQWYDRVVEFVFNGLDRLPPFPKTCYQHESILVRKEFNRKQRNTSSSAEFNFGSDNMNSMLLRFKICAIVYYWSLVFDKRVFSGKSFGRNLATHLEPSELVKLICDKFSKIDYRYLSEFYYSLLSESAIPNKYKSLFLMNVATRLLKNMIGSSESVSFELDNFLRAGEGNNQVHNLDMILSWITEPSIYAQLTEDESWTAFENFYQSWMKMNFLLEWALSSTLCDLKHTGNMMYKDSIIYEKVKAADRLREIAFQEFLVFSSKPLDESNLNFNLDQGFVDSVNRDMMTWEPFTLILSNYL
ncbi:hypothetical protein CANMA_003870 [Candida margitis]|uniref:uncharacterized protein n=1 Tax=Candida margitis TaxID=1775924 RepID=UPI0022264C16|nr:uncharacterized protein CANMA_003870 [Candida margitis]KAI5961096.1 hypothetical protein CANMA_003870 [Candida margitis]